MRLDLIRKLHVLMSELNILEYKEHIYEGYNVSSSRDMSDKQLTHLIGVLERQKQETDNTKRKLLSDCLTIITSSKWMGFPNGDWETINTFVKSKTIGDGKTLSQMNNEELVKCKKRLVMAHSKGLRYRN